MPLTAGAVSFQRAAPSGQMLYYNITSANTVTVVSPDWLTHEMPTGDLVIPATVDDDNGNTYYVTAIGQDAFSLCSGLTSVVIPEGVTSLGSFSFYNCTSLAAVTLPSTLNEIRAQVFYGTAYLADSANWDTTGQLYIGRYLIATRPIIDSTLVVKDSTIGVGAMAVYYNLCAKIVRLPETIRFIGGLAFSACDNLDTVEFSDTIPPAVLNDSFDTIRRESLTMKVPCGGGDEFRSHTVWGLFNIVEYGCPDTPPIDPPDPPDPRNPEDPQNPQDPQHPDDPTVPNDDINVWTDDNGLVIHVSVGAEIYVFDIDAHILFHTVATANVIRVPINNSGVYVIRREGSPFPVPVVYRKH